MVLHGPARSCTVLHGSARFCTVLYKLCTVLHGPAWFCTVLHGPAWSCTVLYELCTVLHGLARSCMSFAESYASCTMAFRRGCFIYNLTRCTYHIRPANAQLRSLLFLGASGFEFTPCSILSFRDVRRWDARGPAAGRLPTRSGMCTRRRVACRHFPYRRSGQWSSDEACSILNVFTVGILEELSSASRRMFSNEARVWLT